MPLSQTVKAAELIPASGMIQGSNLVTLYAMENQTPENTGFKRYQFLWCNSDGSARPLVALSNLMWCLNEQADGKGSKFLEAICATSYVSWDEDDLGDYPGRPNPGQKVSYALLHDLRAWLGKMRKRDPTNSMAPNRLIKVVELLGYLRPTESPEWLWRFGSIVWEPRTAQWDEPGRFNTNCPPQNEAEEAYPAVRSDLNEKKNRGLQGDKAVQISDEDKLAMRRQKDVQTAEFVQTDGFIRSMADKAKKATAAKKEAEAEARKNDMRAPGEAFPGSETFVTLVDLVYHDAPTTSRKLPATSATTVSAGTTVVGTVEQSVVEDVKFLEVVVRVPSGSSQEVPADHDLEKLWFLPMHAIGNPSNIFLSSNASSKDRPLEALQLKMKAKKSKKGWFACMPGRATREDSEPTLACYKPARQEAQSIPEPESERTPQSEFPAVTAAAAATSGQESTADHAFDCQPPPTSTIYTETAGRPPAGTQPGARKFESGPSQAPMPWFSIGSCMGGC